MNFDKFPPNLDPHIFSLLAVMIGYAAVGHLDVNEQNSIGNWFELVGQYMLTHAAQQQLIEGRIEKTNININSKKHKNGGSYYTDNEKGKSNQTQRKEVDLILETLSIMQEELNKLKKQS